MEGHLDYWYSDCSHEGFQLWDEPASEEEDEQMRQYLVTLLKDESRRSYFVYASSKDSAKQVVLNFEPYYNPEWGLEVRAV